MREALERLARALPRLLSPLADSRGQVLPLALIALAVGTLLVSPFLVNASANLLASRSIDHTVTDTYSADAGIEWALWNLMNDPLLTSDTSYTETPLQPTPAAVNGLAFPTTEIRYVPDAGMATSITPAWQGGGSAQCYPFESTEDGSIFATVTFGAGQVWIELLADGDPCQKSPGLSPMSGTSPYVAQFPDQPAGAYQLLVETAPAGAGSVSIDYPVAAYDIRSQANGRTITVRATASLDGVRVFSWQLN
jgi:hypothetical protein